MAYLHLTSMIERQEIKFPYRKNYPSFGEFGLSETSYSRLKSEKQDDLKKIQIKENKLLIPLSIVGFLIGFLIYKKYATFFNSLELVQLIFFIPFAISFWGFICYFLLNFKSKLQIKKVNVKYQNLNSYEYTIECFNYWKKRSTIQFWKDMNGYRFENELAILFQQNGYTATATKGSGDGGIDIFLVKDGKEIIVQCKNHAKQIGPAPIRELFGVMNAKNYKFSIIAAPSGFSKGAFDFARGKSIELMDIYDIIRLQENSFSVSDDNSFNVEGDK